MDFSQSPGCPWIARELVTGSTVWLLWHRRPNNEVSSLRRRFEQNQTDCTYTVLALLPTATENIIEALPVEELTKELQKKRAERLARLNAGDAAGSDMTSVAPSVTEDDRKSLSSFQSEGYLHTSQLGESVIPEAQAPPKRNKTQLWNEVKITCMQIGSVQPWLCMLTPTPDSNH